MPCDHDSVFEAMEKHIEGLLWQAQECLWLSCRMAKFTSSADLSVRLFALGEKSLRKTKPSPEHSFGWPSFLLDAQTQGLRDYLVDKVLLFTERFPSQLTQCITCTEQDKTLVLPVVLLPMSCCVAELLSRFNCQVALTYFCRGRVYAHAENERRCSELVVESA